MCVSIVCLFISIAAVQGYAKEESVMLHDGTMLVGQVLSCTEDALELKYRAGDREVVEKFPVEELDPYTYYSNRSRYIEGDAGAHIELAIYCVENRMFARAISLYERAKELDPAFVEKFDEEEKPRLREEYAAKLLANAVRYIEKNQIDKAESEISLILLYWHDTRAANEARRLVLKVGEAKLAKEAAAREAAQSRAEGQPALTRIIMKDGTSVSGEVVETTEDSVRVMRRKGTAAATSTIRVDRMDPVSYFRVRMQNLGDDAKGYLQLAMFCIDNGMFARAFLCYEHAKSLDPALVEYFDNEVLPDLRENYANQLLEEAQEAIEKGHLENVETDLSLILTRFPDTAKAEEAGKLLDRLAEAQIAEAETRNRTALAEFKEEEKAAEEQRLKVLKPVEKVMEQARGINYKALKNTREGRAMKEFESAAARFKQAVKQLDSLRKKHSEDTMMTSKIDSLRNEAVSDAVDAYLNAGNICVERSSYEQANKYGKDALKLDPDNSRIHSFMSRVEMYSVISASDTRRIRR
ncbi:MAG: hypothetical protein ACYTG7_11795 [Planctomycetota bacterium]